ncbi:MAG: pyridoxal phosphate-dependent aminotransferase [Chitinophagaceae bacterium]
MLTKTATRLESVNEYYFSQKLREIDALNKEGKNIINLGIGSPDLPPHPDVIKVLHEESSKPTTHAYQGYKGSPVLRKAISDWYQKWYNVTLGADTEILPLIGSKEGLMHICMTYLNEGDVALIPNPGYPTYKTAVTLAGGKAIDYILKEENDWLPDFDRLEKICLSNKNCKLLFVNYPNMPTGRLPSLTLFTDLVNFAKKHHLLIIHDNPYSFILNDKPRSILSVEGSKEVAVELNSLSKSHNMAGWRVGMLCGAKQRIDDVLRFKSNMDSGMFLPVQLAAAKALTLNEDWHKKINSVYAQRRLKVFELLQYLHCNFSKTQAGMFVWAKIAENYKNGYEVSDEILHKSGVFITPGGIFGDAGNNYVRVSLCTKEEIISQAIERIKK